MSKLLALLLGAVLSSTAVAQQVSQPAPATSVTTNAVLAASSTLAFPNGVWRNCYSTAACADPLFYKPLTGTCTANSLVNDGGSCVNSGNGNSWKAQFPASGLDPHQFGAVGDGTTDDTAAVQATLNAATNSTILLGLSSYAVSGLVCNTRVQIIGTGGLTSGFRPTAVNQTTLTLNSGCGNSLLRSFWVFSNAKGTNTSGAAISMAADTLSITLEHMTIGGACVGLDVNGNSHHVNNLLVTSVTGGSCIGVRVGHLTTNTATVDFRLSNSTLASEQTPITPGGVGLKIEDSGGMMMSNTDILFFNKGTVIKPGDGGLANQQVWWSFFDNTILGDTTIGTVFEIDTARTDAQIRSVSCIGCWIGSSVTGSGLTISNTAAAPALSLSGFHFIGTRVYNNFMDGVVLNAGSDIDFEASHICGNSVSPGRIGVNVASNVNKVRIRGGAIGGSCDGFIRDYSYGIFLNGPNTGVIVQGVDLTQSNDFAYATGTGVVGIFSDNLGLPLPPYTPTVTASPMTYTASNTHESLCLTGGVVSSVTVGGLPTASGTNTCTMLAPHQAAVITYSAAPAMTVLRQ